MRCFCKNSDTNVYPKLPAFTGSVSVIKNLIFFYLCFRKQCGAGGAEYVSSEEKSDDSLHVEFECGRPAGVCLRHPPYSLHPLFPQLPLAIRTILLQGNDPPNPLLSPPYFAANESVTVNHKIALIFVVTVKNSLEKIILS